MPFIEVPGAKYRTKKWVSEPPEKQVDTHGGRNLPKQAVDHDELGEASELSLNQIQVGDHIHLQTNSLSLYIIKVTAIGPNYLTGSLVFSSGSVSASEAQSITINRFPIKTGEAVRMNPVFETSPLFKLGILDTIDTEIFNKNVSEHAVQEAFGVLSSSIVNIDEIEKALQTLIDAGRMINDPKQKLSANPGIELKKIKDAFQRLIEGQIESLDELQGVVFEMNITRVFSLDDRVFEGLKIYFEVLQERKGNKNKVLQSAGKALKRIFGK